MMRRDMSGALRVAFTLVFVSLLLWRLWLSHVAAVPPRIEELLGPTPEWADTAGRMILILDHQLRESGEKNAQPPSRAMDGIPVEIVNISENQTDGNRKSRKEGQRWLALLRSYGYTELPVLLTVDSDGRVVWVRKPNDSVVDGWADAEIR